MLRRRLPGQEHPGQRVLARYLPASRRRGLHLRRRDRPDRKPRRQAGLAAHQAAVSGRRRRVSQADGRQQHRDGLLRHPNRGPRRRVVQEHRRAGRSQQPPRRRQLRPEALLPERPRQQARLLRSAAGHHLPAADRRIRRRRLEGAQSQGGDSRRHQHGPVDRGGVRHAARLHRTGHASAAWGWARRPSWCSTRRFRWSTFCTTAAGSSPTKAAGSVRPVAKAPPGR